MMKKSLLVLCCFISLIIFVSMLYGQEAKKSVTLPSGEVVCDLNGEWEAIVKNYGLGESLGTYPQIYKITQEGSSFVGIRMQSEPFGSAKDSQAIQGQLDKSGITKVMILTETARLESKGQISEDGNKIIIDDGQRINVTMTRK